MISISIICGIGCTNQCSQILTSTTLCANSADGKLIIFFSHFPRKWALRFHANCLLRRNLLQIALEDNLHEISNPIFWKKYRKYFKMFCLLKFLPSMLNIKSIDSC